MKFYQVTFSAEGGNSGGSKFFTSLREAKAASANFLRENPGEFSDLYPHNITPTKAGILHWINIYATHPDNG